MLLRCVSCPVLFPQKLEPTYKGRCAFLKVDAQQNYQLAQHYKVSKLPTLLVFRGGVQASAACEGAHLRGAFEGRMQLESATPQGAAPLLVSLMRQAASVAAGGAQLEHALNLLLPLTFTFVCRWTASRASSLPKTSI